MQDLVLSNLVCLGTLLGGLVALLYAMHLVERIVGAYVSRQLGWNGVLVTGWLGVPVHELGHLLAAKLFDHRVVAWKLFDPDPVTGTLGYVRHAPSNDSLWQRAGNFFVGIAPPLAAFVAIFALYAWMVPTPTLRSAVWAVTSPMPNVDPAAIPRLLMERTWWLASDLVQAAWEHKTTWLPLQIYVGICVTSHASPSADDLAETGFGLLLTLAAVTATAALLGVAGVSTASWLVLLAPLALLAALAAAFQAGYATLLAALVWGKRRLVSRAPVKAVRRRAGRCPVPSRART